MKLTILGDEEIEALFRGGDATLRVAERAICTEQAKVTAKQILELIMSPTALTKIVTELEKAIK